MTFQEIDLENLIFSNLGTPEKKQNLIDRGLSIIKHYDLAFRQVDLGRYGRLDLAFLKYNHCGFSEYTSRSVSVLVMEIKKGEINMDSFLQAVRYTNGIRRLFNDTVYEPFFTIALVGATVSKSDFCYLPDVIDNLHIYTTHLHLDKGITFKEERGYKLTDEGLCRNIGNEDVFKKYILSKIKKSVYEPEELPF